VGLRTAPAREIQGGTVEANLRHAQAVLAGEHGAPRDAVLLNSAAGMVVAGLAADLRGGVQRAAEAIDSGAARAKLDQVREVSMPLKGAAVAP
jgi:anthranilate phosphoribosyltransferase